MRKYTEEFKQYVLERYLAGETAPELQQSLNLRPGLVYEWASAYRQLKAPKPPMTEAEVPPEVAAPVEDVLPHEETKPHGDDIVSLLRKLVHLLSA